MARVANYPYATPFQRQRDHALVATMLHAGLRRREVLRLQVRDVDAEHRTVFVGQGKGGKDRIVPMYWHVAAILTEYLDARRRAGKTCPEVFTLAVRDCGLTVNALQRVLARLQRIGGMPLRPHQLRHTFTTLMLEGGAATSSLCRKCWATATS